MSEQELQAIKEQLANVPEGWTINEGTHIIKGLKISGNYLVAEVEFLHAQRDSQAEIIEKVRAENERLRATLEFYAKESTYWYIENPSGKLLKDSRINKDLGSLARKALAGDSDAI